MSAAEVAAVAIVCCALGWLPLWVLAALVTMVVDIVRSRCEPF